MGIRWDDENKRFEPMPPWLTALIGGAVGFAFGYLVFVR